MKEIILVTDGSADFPQNWKEKYHIMLLPLWLRFKEASYQQDVDITPRLFYELVNKSREIPKTAFPSPDQMTAFYHSIAEKGDQILSLHVASKLSGTFSAVQQAACQLINELDLYPIDSGAGSAALAFMCRDVRLLEQAGYSMQKIKRHLDQASKKLKIVFTVDNLEYARLSGRVNLLQSTLSSLLKLKPVIELREGLLEVIEKVRTRQKAFNWLLEYAREYTARADFSVAVVHANNLPAAEHMKELLEKLENVKEVVITELAIPVAAHLGPGTVGLVLYPALSSSFYQGNNE